MELMKKVFFASIVLSMLASAANAQSPPAPILPPSPAPAPAPAPHHVNITHLLNVAGPFHTFLGYLIQTGVIETFQNQANNSRQGVTIFVPGDSAFRLLNKSDLANFTREQLKTLFLYHAFPKYYSLSDFKTVNKPVSTFAGGQNTLNITDTSGAISVVSDWAAPKITSSVYSTDPVAIYEVDHVLLPSTLFSANPPLVPAPASAPEVEKPSDSAPTKSADSSSPSKPSKSEKASSSQSICIGLLNYLVLAVCGGLMLAI